MNGGSRIVDLSVVSTTEWPPRDAATEIDRQPAWQDEEESVTDRSRLGPALAALAIVGSLAWIGVMTALAWPALPTLPPASLAAFVASLCVPPALVGVIWLLAMRTSRVEARRFGASAAGMRAEAAALEQRVALLSDLLTDQRARVAESAQALAAIGDRTVAQLGNVGRGLSGEVGTVEAHVRRLAESATTAETSLGVLLASLPRAHTETQAMAGSIERAGLTAGEQAAALDAQIVALGERGRETDTVTGGAAQRLAAHIARMEATSETAGARLEAVISEMSGAVDQLLGRAAGAMDEARKGIAAQGEAMLAMLETNQAALDRTSRETIDGLAERIGATEAAIGRIADLLARQHASSDTLFVALDHGIGHAEERLGALHANGLAQTDALARSITALGGSADAMAGSLRTGHDTARNVIGTAEDLLTALDAAAREIDETLPAALARLDERIAASRAAALEAHPEIGALVSAAGSAQESLRATAAIVAEQRATVDDLAAALAAALADARDKADALGVVVDGAISRTATFSDTAAPQLVHALAKARETADAAAERARQAIAAVIPEAAAALERAGSEALTRAGGLAVDARIGALSRAANDALAATAAASDRLEAQLRAIAEATAIIDSRIDDVRDEREAASRDGFASRVSLLVDALNSASIDITRTFSNEVADGAWAAYLKGDRGVFTRRAVRLLDPAEARDVLSLYDEDGDFRSHVNRYIHDFEAMLRAILAQREGQHLGVTLLSSDMGKLYVALAQAIERLRT